MSPERTRLFSGMSDARDEVGALGAPEAPSNEVVGAQMRASEKRVCEEGSSERCEPRNEESGAAETQDSANAEQTSDSGPCGNERGIDGASAFAEDAEDDTQLAAIRELMTRASARDVWLTLAEIAEATEFAEASISAQLRHLRKAQNGGHRVEKRHRRQLSANAGMRKVREARRGPVIWEYRVLSARASRTGTDAGHISSEQGNPTRVHEAPFDKEACSGGTECRNV